MVIKEVTTQNFPGFYEVFSELMHEGYGRFPEELREYFLTKDYSKENFSFWLERNFRKIIIIVDEQTDEIRGFLVGDHTYGGVGFVSWLGVRKPYRNSGLGAQLLTAYESYARSLKAHLIELYTSEPLIPYYQKHGFVEIGRREQGFYGQQNVIMNKRLAEWNNKNLQSNES